MADPAEFVHVVVGGLPYSIAVRDIEKCPGGFFECMIKKEWMSELKPIMIERDGSLFKYVNAFLVTGCIPRNKHGEIALCEDVLLRLQEEADFYGLDALSEQCRICRKKANSDIEGYLQIKEYLRKENWKDCGTWEIDYASDLVQALKEAWSPLCDSGRLPKFHHYNKNLLPNSTISDLDLSELTAAATSAPDSAILEIPACQLNSAALRSVASSMEISCFPPHLVVELRAQKLQMHQQGSEQLCHTVLGSSHLGTMVVILNSEYTGGELVVSHGGRTETVTGAYNWVAMYGDCLHKINPVTSGTRVSLIYDIYRKPVSESRQYGSVNQDTHREVEMTFWKYQGSFYRRLHAVKTVSRPIDAQLAQKVVTGIDQELLSVDCVVITLSKLYSDGSNDPYLLQDNDRALYDLLSEQFDVQVVVLSVYNNYDPRVQSECFTRCALFSTDQVERVLPSRDYYIGAGYYGDTVVEQPSPYKDTRFKWLVVNRLDRAGLLKNKETEEDERVIEASVYIVSCLQVRRRAV